MVIIGHNLVCAFKLIFKSPTLNMGLSDYYVSGMSMCLECLCVWDVYVSGMSMCLECLCVWNVWNVWE